MKKKNIPPKREGRGFPRLSGLVPGDVFLRRAQELLVVQGDAGDAAGLMLLWGCGAGGGWEASEACRAGGAVGLWGWGG